MDNAGLRKNEFETLSDFRYQLRRFIHWSEELTRGAGVTNLHHLLMLHVKGYWGRDWATITELAERLQSKHHGVVAPMHRQRIDLYTLRFIRNSRGLDVSIDEIRDLLSLWHHRTRPIRQERAQPLRPGPSNAGARALPRRIGAARVRGPTLRPPCRAAPRTRRGPVR